MKMSYPKLTFKYDKTTEAERIAYTVNSLYNSNKRYTHFGMLVLPYLFKNTIFLPSLPPYLLQQLSKHQSKDWLKFYNYNINTISDLHNYVNLIDSNQQLKMENVAKAIFPKFIDTLRLLMPGAYDGVKEVIIRPTGYGTTASEISSYQANRDVIEVYWRADCSASAVFAMILAERFFWDAKLAKLEWQTKMQIVYFLMSNTILKELFPDFSDNNITDVDYSTMPAKVLKDAESYLKSLGLKSNQSFWHDNMGINFRGKHIRLTKSEKALMQLLIAHQGELVSYDSISLEVWGHNNITKFSLNAIAKTVQRIRKKLKRAGINPKLIEVYSGEGYRLASI